MSQSTFNTKKKWPLWVKWGVGFALIYGVVLFLSPWLHSLLIPDSNDGYYYQLSGRASIANLFDYYIAFPGAWIISYKATSSWEDFESLTLYQRFRSLAVPVVGIVFQFLLGSLVGFSIQKVKNRKAVQNSV